MILIYFVTSTKIFKKYYNISTKIFKKYKT